MLEESKTEEIMFEERQKEIKEIFDKVRVCLTLGNTCHTSVYLDLHFLGTTQEGSRSQIMSFSVQQIKTSPSLKGIGATLASM